MKKLLILSTCIIFTSCGYATMDASKPIVIKVKNKIDENFSNYYGKGEWGLNSPYFKFKDSSRKFSIGDTIRFTK